MTTYEGGLDGSGLKIALVAARFNEAIVGHLVDGARATCARHGVAPDDVDLVRVPGAYEIPQIARRLAVRGRYDAIVCLGAVIRGATPHFDYVAGAAAYGVEAAARETGVPMTFGVLTTDSVEQAIERAGTKAGNKGADAAAAAIEMANLARALDGGGGET